MNLKSLSDIRQYKDAGLDGAYHLVYYVPKNRDTTTWSNKVLSCKEKPNNKIIVECVDAIENEDLIFDYVIRVMGHDEIRPLKNAPIIPLVKAVANSTNALYLTQVLNKTRKTKQLHTFSRVSQREAEVRDVFFVNDESHDLNGKTILIVDDITTSCTTVAEMIKTLKRKWPTAKFYLFCIARTDYNPNANVNI